MATIKIGDPGTGLFTVVDVLTPPTYKGPHRCGPFSSDLPGIEPANGLTTSPSARSGTGEACPRPRWELAGVPKIEVVGLSKKKVEELFWDTVTQVRADLAGVSRK